MDRLEGTIDVENLAAALATAAIEKKGEEVTILDMRGLVSYTDYFVLVTATNRRQAQAIADYIRAETKEKFQLHAEGVEGVEAARWVLVDFGDVVVHIFDKPMRGFYDLDGLWQDAPRIDTPDVEPPNDTEAEPVFSWPG